MCPFVVSPLFSPRFSLSIVTNETNMSTFEQFLKPFKRPKFINKEFDFTILPDNFIKWLEVEEDITEGEYKNRVSNMCEYSCLYICLLLQNSLLKGKLYVVDGNFGFWEHFWMEYHYEGKVYIIDLTLQQFLPTSPKLAVSEASNDKQGYNYTYAEKVSLNEYLEQKDVEGNYTCPHTFKPSKRKPVDFAEEMRKKTASLMGALGGSLDRWDNV